MRIAYFDCFSGISGDMILGALVDTGLPIEELRSGIRKLKLAGVDLKAEKVKRGGFTGTKVQVITPHEHHGHRHLSDILDILEQSDLGADVTLTACQIFKRLAEAEAAVHGLPVEKIHFHEVGGLDTIVDVTGAVIGLHTLQIEEVYASAINVGGGKIQASHGELPVPAPGAAALLQGVPVYGSAVEAELATPTGVAIITTLAKGFGPLPSLTVTRIGYGAGRADLKGRANLLRIIVGEAITDVETDEVTVLETNIDDMNPQLYEPLMEALFQAGALDVFLTPVIMKKSRPATVVSVIVAAGTESSIAPILFQFSTTFGVRYRRMHRQKLPREMVTVETRFGEVQVKVGRLQGQPIHLSPEYDQCRRLAETRGVAIGEIIVAAVEAARRMLAAKEH